MLQQLPPILPYSLPSLLILVYLVSIGVIDDTTHGIAILLHHQEWDVFFCKWISFIINKADYHCLLHFGFHMWTGSSSLVWCISYKSYCSPHQGNRGLLSQSDYHLLPFIPHECQENFTQCVIYWSALEWHNPAVIILFLVSPQFPPKLSGLKVLHTGPTRYLRYIYCKYNHALAINVRMAFTAHYSVYGTDDDLSIAPLYLTRHMH